MTFFWFKSGILNGDILVNILIDFINYTISLIIDLLILDTVILPFVIVKSYDFNSFIKRKEIQYVITFLFDNREPQYAVFEMKVTG